MCPALETYFFSVQRQHFPIHFELLHSDLNEQQGTLYFRPLRPEMNYKLPSEKLWRFQRINAHRQRQSSIEAIIV